MIWFDLNEFLPDERRFSNKRRSANDIRYKLFAAIRKRSMSEPNVSR